MNDATLAVDTVKEYYGKTLSGNGDLKTSACCATDAIPSAHRRILKMIDREVLDRFYGCGSPIPPDLTGRTVLDLGCGTGRDVFVASYLVGESGRVIGVDMTEEQLAVGRRHVASQMQKFGFARPNVTLKQGYIERLSDAGIEDNSVDLVISNCVINLSPSKRDVFREIFRVLKPGGELYFADVFSSRRVPAALREHPLLYAECLGGALYIEDFRRLLADLGYNDYRLVAQKQIATLDGELETLAGMIDFSSLTVRAFKLNDLEDRCEDYGQMAIYKGTIAESPHQFILDDHHIFRTGKPLAVCGNTASMLQDTWYSSHFQIIGDRSVHFGIFDCDSGGPIAHSDPNTIGNACC